MDNYKEATTKTTNQVRFSINQDGNIKFDANGVEAWQLTDTIAQTHQIAREGYKARQKLKEIEHQSQMASHVVFLVFIAFITSVTAFSCSRIVSTQFNDNQPTMEQSK